MGLRRSRRRWLGIGAGLALVGATVLAGTSPAAAQQEPPPGLIPEGDWTDTQVRTMLRLIDRTERVLPRAFPTSYSDGGAELRAMGYFNFGATAPGGYDHWINPQRVVDDHTLKPRFAESVVYRHVGGGVWELQAAMFMLPPDIGMSDIPDRIAWLPGWHGHPELCVNPNGTFAGITDPDNPNCPPGTSQATTPIMTHVWLDDPGCGHRFGAVGVGGLHCDTGHDDDHDDGGHDDDHEVPPGLIPEGNWTEGQINALLDWIERTETVLPERFPTSFSDGGSELQAMGFFNFGATAPGGYDHWINPAWIEDGRLLNPEFAESLVYRNVGGGVWELQAAMYMLPPAWDVPDIPALISWVPGWHGHPELCVNPDGTFAGITDPDNPNCPAGTSQATTPVMTHVWLDDPGCGHRFGAVGVGGLHCDTGHDDGGHDDGGHDDGGHDDGGHG